VEAIPVAQHLLFRHYRFPVTCYAWA